MVAHAFYNPRIPCYHEAYKTGIPVVLLTCRHCAHTQNIHITKENAEGAWQYFAASLAVNINTH